MCTVAALLGAVSVAVVSLINHEQPEPYMVGSQLQRTVIATTRYMYMYDCTFLEISVSVSVCGQSEIK